MRAHRLRLLPPGRSRVTAAGEDPLGVERDTLYQLIRGVPVLERLEGHPELVPQAELRETLALFHRLIEQLTDRLSGEDT